MKCPAAAPAVHVMGHACHHEDATIRSGYFGQARHLNNCIAVALRSGISALVAVILRFSRNTVPETDFTLSLIHTCHGLSQSSGIGKAPSHAPNAVSAAGT